MQGRDFHGSTRLSCCPAHCAAATAATITSGNQVLAQAQPEPGVNPDRPNVPYEGSKLNRKLQIVNLLDLEPEAQKILPAGGFGYISGGSGANWTRRENTEAFSRVQIEPQALSGVAKVDLTTEILGSKLSMPVFIPPMGSHGRAHVEKEAATSQGRGRGRHADDDLDGVEPEPGGDRVAQSRPEMVPALCADRPRLHPRAAAARQGRRLHRDRADRRQRLVLSARGEHPQRVRDAGVARPGQHAARRGLRHGRENDQCPQARPRLERPGVDQAGVRPAGHAQGRAVGEGGARWR